MNEFMKIALNEAEDGISKKDGGPFGAVIVKDGKIVGKGHNTVLISHNPTKHAEMNAISDACNTLSTHDLKGCILYTSCEPCPMCISASIWANIKEIYYGCNKFDAEKIGFRDNMIYDYLSGNKVDVIKTYNVDRTACLKVFEKYTGKMY